MRTSSRFEVEAPRPLWVSVYGSWGDLPIGKSWWFTTKPWLAQLGEDAAKARRQNNRNQMLQYDL